MALPDSDAKRDETGAAVGLPSRAFRAAGQVGRRGRVWPVALAASLGGGALGALLLAAWLAGWFSGPSRRNALKTAPPAAELKLELATPIPGSALAEEAPLPQTLAAVAAAVDAKAAQLDDPTRLAALQGRDSWNDQRKAEAGANRAWNWELRFSKGLTKDKYAQQLDFFGIELAVVMPGNQLIYVSRFTKAKPDVRKGAADAETRWYMTWRVGDLGRADADLLARAGIHAEDRVVLKMLPPALEAKLAELEKERAGGLLPYVCKTQFGIRAAGDAYEFYVVEQYRNER